MNKKTKKKVIIVGAGPAGLFCAYLLLKKGHQVEVYDQSTGPAKKFLIAGNGGLNLTHSEDLKSFSGRYGKDEKLFYELIQEFSPEDLRSFCEDLGVETFVGTSGRVFPKNLKAAQILLSWLKALKSDPNFGLYLKHSLIGIDAGAKELELTFKNPDTQIKVAGERVILAMGGASWKKTGSDGKWKPLLEKLRVEVKEFKPMNCGFERPWSKHFVESIERAPLKNVEISFQDKSVRGEIMLTEFGIEGGGIYALSNHIRDGIEQDGSAKIFLDLKPDLTQEDVLKKISKRKPKDSFSNHLRKALGFTKVENTLLKELTSIEEYQNHARLAETIKKLEVELFKTRPIDEAISTSGGVAFHELDEWFQLKAIPGLYIAGEMLNFEAPTGGYLLQGCFSSAYRVVSGIGEAD